MFFKKKRSTVQKAFENHHYVCRNILKSSGIAYTSVAAFDILPIMYVVSDFAVATACKDRQAAAKEMQAWIFDQMPEEHKSELTAHFDRRLDFYGQVIRGKQLRGYCFPGVDLSSADSNPMLRCSIAFTDCLLDEACIDDYDDAPFPLFGIFETLGIAEKFTFPFGDELISLYNDIYRNAR